VAGGDRPLDLAENRGTQVDIAGPVVAVDVSERRREEVAAALAAAERVDNRERFFGRGIETSVRAVAADAVLLAADGADLDLENHVCGGAFCEQRSGDGKVLFEGQARPVEHL
jgi:hypothetical protein